MIGGIVAYVGVIGRRVATWPVGRPREYFFRPFGHLADGRGRDMKLLIGGLGTG